MKHTNLLTQADRDMFDRIDRDCIAMHVCPPPKTFIELSVKDGDGNEVERYTDRAHSWVRNMYNALLTVQYGASINTGTLYQEGSTRIKKIDGTIISGASNSALIVAGSGEGTSGIIIGTGTGAESFESYALTQIQPGNASGQMIYNAQTFAALAYNSGTKKWTEVMTRVFNNNSGASIIVGEVGLVSGSIWLQCRDLLASAVTVPNAGQLAVTCTIEMTFPA